MFVGWHRPLRRQSDSQGSTVNLPSSSTPQSQRLRLCSLTDMKNLTYWPPFLPFLVIYPASNLQYSLEPFFCFKNTFEYLTVWWIIQHKASTLNGRLCTLSCRVLDSDKMHYTPCGMSVWYASNCDKRWNLKTQIQNTTDDTIWNPPQIDKPMSCLSVYNIKANLNIT